WTQGVKSACHVCAIYESCRLSAVAAQFAHTGAQWLESVVPWNWRAGSRSTGVSSSSQHPRKARTFLSGRLVSEAALRLVCLVGPFVDSALAPPLDLRIGPVGLSGSAVVEFCARFEIVISRTRLT